MRASPIAPQTDPQILLKSHIIKHINEAIDRVRRAETRQYKGTNKECLLTRSRWPLLKNKVNLTENQVVKLKVLLMSRLKSVKSYLMKGNHSARCFLWFFKDYCGCISIFPQKKRMAMR